MSKFNQYYKTILNEGPRGRPVSADPYSPAPRLSASGPKRITDLNPGIAQYAKSLQPAPRPAVAKAGPITGGSFSAAASPSQQPGLGASAPVDAQVGPQTALNDIYAMLDAARTNNWNQVKQILGKYEGAAPEGYLPKPGVTPMNPRVMRAQPVDQAARDAELAAKGYQKIGPGGTRTERDGSVRRKSKFGGVAGSLSNFLGDVGNTLTRR